MSFTFSVLTSVPKGEKWTLFDLNVCQLISIKLNWILTVSNWIQDHLCWIQFNLGFIISNWKLMTWKIINLLLCLLLKNYLSKSEWVFVLFSKKILIFILIVRQHLNKKNSNNKRRLQCIYDNIFCVSLLWAKNLMYRKK